MTQTPDPTAAPRRILVVKLSSLGDLFHALPAVHALRAGWGAEVDWVTQSEYVDLVRCFPDVRRVIGFRRRTPWRGLPAFVRALRAERYDLVADLQGLLKSAWMARLARAPLRIGPSFAREGSALFYTRLAGPRDRNRHAVEEGLDLVRRLGLPTAPVAFPVRFPERVMETAGPRVGLFPVSRWPAKNWPVERYAEAARRLQAQSGAAVYVFGGRSDAEVCARIAAALPPPVVNLAGTTSFVETGAAVARMSVVIGSDSGPLHMAAACGVRVVALFGPTDPRRTGPWGAGHRVLQSPAACQPCHAYECTRAAGRCIDAIAVEAVVDAALDVLRSSP